MAHQWVYRENDEVVIRVDIATAEKLLAVINRVRDDTVINHGPKVWDDLGDDLQEQANVRHPSPLYAVNVYGHPANGVWAITYKD